MTDTDLIVLTRSVGSRGWEIDDELNGFVELCVTDHDCMRVQRVIV
jgi:hypothetical protein